MALHVVVQSECPLCDGVVRKLEAIQSKARFSGNDFWASMSYQVRPRAGSIILHACGSHNLLPMHGACVHKVCMRPRTSSCAQALH